VLDDCPDGAADCGVEVDDELDEFEPHAATPSAISTTAPASSRRTDLVGVEFMVQSFIPFVWAPVNHRARGNLRPRSRTGPD
jgi:hypothetical protein